MRLLSRYVVLFCGIVLGMTGKLAIAEPSLSTVITADNIKWGYLNPLRGALSPGAADLWGDRTRNQVTGMLVRFNKGFASPPHIHNISYRGIVIEGLLHNDDPSADKQWMPVSSYWTQPAGQNHITAADGQSNLIYLEIEAGPYLVKPATTAFDNGEQALNMHASNIVWSDATHRYQTNAKGVKVSPIWQTIGELQGSLVRLPPGFEGTLVTTAKEFRLVVIAGPLVYQSSEQAPVSLAAGSYVSSTQAFSHQIANPTETPITLYIRTNEGYSVND